MGKIIAVTNQKGGVGKTTTAVNLAAILGDMGKKVLAVDLDPQGNTTSGFGMSVDDKSTYEALLGREKTSECIMQTRFKNLWVLGADLRLAGAELELVNTEGREYFLKKAIAGIIGEYDYIFIDCSPSLGLLTLNALSACDSVIIPIQCEYYALEGVTSLMTTINRVKHGLNPHIEIEGIVLTMLDGRTNLGLQVVDQVKKHFKKKVFATIIPRSVRLGEAPSHGEPINVYDDKSAGAVAYRKLAQELLDHSKK